MISQRGSVLVVSLIILLVMTLLGVSAMDSSNMEQRMATAGKNRQLLFRAAETTLALGEQYLEDLAIDDNFLQDCPSGNTDCFDDACAGGLCFTGRFSSGETRYECEVPYSGDPVPDPVWRDPVLDVWNNVNKHRAVDISADIDGLGEDPKYIIEFLCFVPKEDIDGNPMPFNDGAGSDNGTPIFRVTALAADTDTNARVALQSTYRVDE